MLGLGRLTLDRASLALLATSGTCTVGSAQGGCSGDFSETQGYKPAQQVVVALLAALGTYTWGHC